MLLTLTVLWGSAFTLTKVAVSGLPAALVVAGRLYVAAMLLIPVALALRHRPRTTPRLWMFMVLIAVFGYALPFSLVSWGQRFIESGVAGILMAVMPLATLGLAHWLIPGERITRYRIGGFLSGFSGVVVLMGPSAWHALMNGETQILPMLAVLAGAISYAVSSILARLRPRSDARFTAAATISIAAVLMTPSALSGVESVAVLEIARSELIAVGLLGIFSTALAAIVYFRLVTVAGPAFVSQLNYLIPLWAVGSGIFFLHERPEPNHLYALALILGGILITQLEHLRR
ncbi:DMT family transporter [Thiorhodococcus mannitoliphagus]|uniref:DMT family transporter n=2 Tax=Thiorhodococcus mannitoliphagus TaxID=329406 RepID=A0A6P1DWQ7_9GAMM|nr:DMT family transporter [Thiorhodococcus mannitoliphagus]NEX21156.1 DMT family transporter [Thiorhodococcus mannitoliphagus]